MKRSIWTLVLSALGVCVAGFLLIQLVPYGRNHADPAVIQEPVWNSPQTKQLVQRACFDCHSNQTAWPWYTNVAPFSWLVQHDVDEGRARLNFSDWGANNTRFSARADRIVRAVEDGRMPPVQYLLIHSNARLTDAEKQQLIAGLEASLK
jgi:mono/diheme cytochrome c family protein